MGGLQGHARTHARTHTRAGIQAHVQRSARDRVVRAQLLLQVGPPRAFIKHMLWGSFVVAATRCRRPAGFRAWQGGVRRGRGGGLRVLVGCERGWLALLVRPRREGGRARRPLVPPATPPRPRPRPRQVRQRGRHPRARRAPGEELQDLRGRPAGAPAPATQQRRPCPGPGPGRAPACPAVLGNACPTRSTPQRRLSGPCPTPHLAARSGALPESPAWHLAREPGPLEISRQPSRRDSGHPTRLFVRNPKALRARNAVHAKCWPEPAFFCFSSFPPIHDLSSQTPD